MLYFFVFGSVSVVMRYQLRVLVGAFLRTQAYFQIMLEAVLEDPLSECKRPTTRWSSAVQFRSNGDCSTFFTDCIATSTDVFIQTVKKLLVSTTLRNTLLPKLISGELRMQDAERFGGKQI